MDVAMTAFALLAAIPAAVVLAESLACLLPRRPTPAGPARPRVAVLIPAHNEQAGIAATVSAIRAQVRAADRVLVVADNCTDQTAAAARSAGAEVIERADAARRGKGYALDFGVAQLAADPPDVVIVIDADCTLHAGSLDALAAAAATLGTACQSTNRVECSPHATLKQRISAFAFRFKNEVRAGGLVRLGGPCLLTGTGMAFPWSVLRAARLASGNLVEDMQLGIDLAVAGSGATLVEHALVTSQVPESDAAWTSQRTRWEHGHLSTLLRHAPRLLQHSLARRRPSLLLLAADLAVPPLALLVTLQAGVFAATTAWALAGGATLPAWLSAAALAALALAVLVGWLRCGREVISLAALLTAPLYVLAKLPLYLRFLVRPQRGWVRTARPAEPERRTQPSEKRS